MSATFTGPGNQELRPGTRLVCAGCGGDTVVKSRRRVEGWTCAGVSLVCALCGFVLVRDWAGADADHAGALAAVAAQKRLAAVLGGVDAAVVRPVLETDGATPFCRDCTHFLKHPFVSRCLLHDMEIDPMHDCAEFRRSG